MVGRDELGTLVAVAAPVAVLASVGSLTGDVLLAAVLLGAGARHGVTGAAAALAALAATVRFGSPALEAIGGGQSVLGPAGLVGPGPAAASAWLAAAAVLLALAGPLPRPGAGWGRAAWSGTGVLVALAAGALAASLVAGPTDRPLLRIGAGLAAVVVAGGIGELRRQWPGAAPLLGAAGVVAGTGALVCALVA